MNNGLLAILKVVVTCCWAKEGAVSMRGKDIVRIAIMAVCALGMFFYGAYLQETYVTQTPYLYFWLGVAVEFTSKAIGIVAVLYSLLRVCIAVTGRFAQPQYRRP